MKKLFYILCGAMWLATAPAGAAETVYSSIIEDLPLMAEMTERADDAVVFDKPAGRIVETRAETAAPAKEIEKFYAAALPPLGWKSASPLKFIRDDEVLELTLEQAAGITSVHFTLTPNSEGK